MGLIRKVASIRMLGGVSSHTRREPPGKAERVRTKAERAREGAAQAQAVRAEAEAKVAEVATRPLTAARRGGPTSTAWVIMMRRTTWNTPATSPGRWWADGECLGHRAGVGASRGWQHAGTGRRACTTVRWG
jgi:hypothetical protein